MQLAHKGLMELQDLKEKKETEVQWAQLVLLDHLAHLEAQVQQAKLADKVFLVFQAKEGLWILLDGQGNQEPLEQQVKQEPLARLDLKVFQGLQERVAHWVLWVHQACQVHLDM